MISTLRSTDLFHFSRWPRMLRWNPNRDLLVVAASWLLVTGALYTATFVVGSATGGGMPYFFLYALLGAAGFGVTLPIGYMTLVRRRPLSDLGIHFRGLALPLILQAAFFAVEASGGLRTIPAISIERLLPLIALALCIGLFEAIFWRGWVLLRLEESFGLLPAILLGSLLYAAYHIGYGMPLSEMTFLFFIGVMYAVAFRLTKSIWVLWPLFQPFGQLITLVKDGLELPVMATLGFVDVIAVIALVIWLANKRLKKQGIVK